MPGPNRRYGSFAQTGGGRWTAAFAHLLPARPERDLVVELRRHAVVATCLLTFCMLFGGARVLLPGVEEGQRGVILRRMDLGAVAVGTGLVLPLAGAQRAFDEDLRALREVFLHDLAEALAVKITTRCHSVRCLRSPLLRSFQLSLVAMLSVTTRPPFCMMRTSGSLPRLPISCTRLARHDLVPSFPPQEGRRLRAGLVPSGAV